MKIIAVTSCPVGMAHTYMASAALKKAAEKLGAQIKVETQGFMGIQDRITQQDIEEADVLILAADVALMEGERFSNLPTLHTTTSKIIKNSEALIKEAMTLGAE